MAKKSITKKRAPAAKSRVRAKKSTAARKRRAAGGAPTSQYSLVSERKGLGPRTGGQSGDTEGLRATAVADAESVEELAEEGQSFESEVVSGVENAPDPDEAEVTTHEVPEDDVPPEYGGEGG